MWGQKTAQLKKSALDRINVRRNLLFIENNVEIALLPFTFENNTVQTRLRAWSIVDEFLAGMDVNFKVAFDESGESASRYKLRGMPSSYLIGRDGKVHASHIGFRDKDKRQLESAIKILLMSK